MNQTMPVDVELTKYVAEFVVGARYEDLSAELLAVGKKSILDGFGLALSGSVAKSGELVRQHLDSLGLGRRRHGDRWRAPRRAALRRLRNGVGIHADDYDDTQLAVAKDRVYGLLTHRPLRPCRPPSRWPR